ncbi:LacI family DNA-binding transcriptional regulator [Herpetosiphon gulosus]|uniref:HTH-type transcriptional repressor PurR n=1 Tax=Herpetosiphon gulosus TaxID=1973496 RepID=A0ABP9WZT0_9CHLR
MSNLKQLAELTELPMLTVYQALDGVSHITPAVREQVSAAAAKLNYSLNITIRDVAALAGVSIGTVSHVLNGSTRTKSTTRQRVLQAITELNYRPNSIARGLKSNHTRLIGYGWHKTEDPSRPNALLDRFLYEMAQAAEAWGYHILTFAQPHPASTKPYAELMQIGRIDGLVLSDISYNDPRINYLLKTDLPFVSFGRANSDWNFPAVDVDSKLGMKLAVEHLIARGHEQIGLLCWPEGMRIGDERLQGYYAAFEAAGLSIDQRSIRHIPNAVDAAFAATQELLNQQPRITALACANDVMAFGAKRYLDLAGLQVGVDLALTGYDDSPIAELLELTSVRQPIDMVAAKVIELLIGEIEATPIARQQIVLEPTLIVRASSRKQR